MKEVFENYKKYKSLGKRQAYHSKTNFSWEKMKETLSSPFLEKNIPEIATKVKLELPKLDKLQLPKLE